MPNTMVYDPPLNATINAHGDSSRWIAAFVGAMPVATRIVKAARQCGLQVRTFDHLEPLLKCCEEKKPEVIFLDWDLLEARCYELLSRIRDLDDWKCVSIIGYVSQKKAQLIPEAQRAGCDRVYPKTAFLAEIELLIARSVQ